MTTKQREILDQALLDAGFDGVYSGWEHLSGSARGNDWTIRFMNEHGDLLDVRSDRHVSFIPNRRTTLSVMREIETGGPRETPASAALRESAAAKDAAAAASFERCDTDGFVSQWALGLGATKDRLQAEIEENGGRASFVSLHDAETGERVRAKLVQVHSRFASGASVSKWIVLDRNDNAAEWIPAFKSGKNSTLAKRGLVESWEMAPAVATYVGHGRGLSGAASVQVVARRTDRGYPDGARTLSEIRSGR